MRKRKKIKKIGKLISIVLIAFLSVTSFMPTTFAKAAVKASYIDSSNNLWVDGCSTQDSEIDAIKWKYRNNRYYLFLPSSADLSNLVIWHTFGSNPYVNGKELRNGEATDAFSSTGVYTMKVGNSTYTVEVMKATSTPAMFLTTDRSMSEINSSKDNSAAGNILVTTSNGTVDYSNVYDKIKGRGNSTWDLAKKPYNLTLDKRYGLLGMDSSTKWSLLANHRDTSLMRNQLTYDLAHEIGLDYSPNSRNVDLYINGEYYGVYELCEKIEVGKNNLVKINDLQGNTEDLHRNSNNKKIKLDSYGQGGKNYYSINSDKYYNIPNNPEDITGGYLLEFEVSARYADEASGFVTNCGQSVIFKSPEFASKKQVEYMHNFYQEFEDAMVSSTGYNSKGKHYTDYIDIESFAKMYLIQEFSKNLDGAITSFYIYKDSDLTGDGKMHAAPVWDFDVAYGNFNDGKRDCSSSSGMWIKNGYLLDSNYNVSSNPNLFNRLFKQADFEEAVVNEWNNEFYAKAKILLDSSSTGTERLKTISEYKKDVSSSAKMNFILWNILNNTDTGVKMGNSLDETTNYLKNFINNRLSYLNGKFKNVNEKTTVYFDNSVSNWSSVYAYVWEGGTSAGTVLSTTKVSGESNIYKVAVSGNYKNIIFKNTDGVTSWDKQSLDLDIPSTSYNCYKPSGTGTKPSGQWYEYSEAKDLAIKSISADKVSPQMLGNTITLTTTAENIQGKCTYEYKVNGEVVTSNNNILTWNPAEVGTYNISVTIKDESGASASKDITYVIKDITDNKVTIYYKGYSTPYIHYRVGTGSWTTAPGVAMYETSEVSGYTHKYEIDLGNDSNSIVCFNNGSGSWDSNGGKNYTFTAGTYTYSNGTITEIPPVNMVVSKFEASVLSPQVVNSEIKLSVATSNGTGSKTYLYTAKVNGEEKVIYEGSDSTINWNPTEVGDYVLTVKVTDANGKKASKSLDYTVVDELSIDKFTVDNSSIAINESANLKVIAKYGIGEYKYKFLLEDGTVLQDGSSNTYEFKSDKIGTYKIKVIVSDNTTVVKEDEVNVTVYNKLSLDEVSVDKTPVSLGESVSFKAKVSGAVNKLMYTFFTDAGVLQSGELDSYVWTPEKEGIYTIKVMVKEEGTDNTIIKQVPIEVVKEEFKIDSFDTSVTSPQLLGSTVDIKGEATGYLAPYTYNITVTDSNDNEVIDVDSNECKWVPNERGTYKIKFTATNSLGESISEEKPFVIKEFNINSFNIDAQSPQKVGTTINISGEATGDGEPYTYEIIIIDEEGNEKTISDTNEANWIPTEAGIYKIKLVATNSDKDVVEESKEFLVQDFKVSSFKANLSSPQQLGKSILLEGEVSEYGYGYTDYKYNISAIDSNGNIVFTADSKEAQWTPEVSGSYTLRFAATSEDNNVVSKDMTYVINEKPKNVVTIYYNGYSTSYIHYKIGSGSWTAVPGVKMESTSELSGFNNKITIDLGEETKLTACFNNGSGSWDNNSSKNYTFEAGTYTLSNKIITEITPIGIQLDNFTTDLVSPQLVNTSVSFKTNVSNVEGTAIYKLISVKDGVEEVIYLGELDSATWTPTESGKYTVRVEVTDGSGNTVKDKIEFEVKEHLSLNSFTVNNSVVEAGDKVTLSMNTANGLGEVNYKFYLDDNTVIYEGTNNTATWTPITSGEYKVYAKAYDETKEEVCGTLCITVKEPKFAIKNFTLSKVSPVQLGTTVNINTLAVGEGAPYTYKIEILNENGEILLTSNSNEVEWKAESVGKYNIKLTVTNGLGEVLTSEKSFVVEDVPSTLTTIYYKGYIAPYIHYRVGNGAWTIAPGVAMKASTTKPGYYEITIDLGDETTLTACFNNGLGSWDNNNSKNYTFGVGKYICENKIVTDITEKKLELSSIETNKGTSAVIGSKVTISAVAEYGSGDYKYKFIEIKDGVETVISDYTSNSSVNWNASELGEYTLKVLVMDSEGNIVEKTMNFTVNDVVKNIVKIYYTGYSSPYIHYKVGNGTWTTVPGVLMTSSSSNYGDYEFAIDLGNEALATVCFNNGNGSWDSNGGKNYTFTAGEFIFKNSTITKVN